ncbi:50S ribosomal protein L21 [Altererythrobacter sp. TH136]|uniref:50S ribosomal protein L21 n=1 Tax=Altererythrobacter sp. TH136 TaxID=2067415 RepID=UPI001164B5FF|nr:50S ribosomal protein L21 [Altererythrobacter sp. TH136]QDM42070.1 50S ribosomal protein L21 [Altererythrobacter sp. TH136]
MFAVVRTGGKQYRVAAGDKIAVEKLAGDAGETITLGDVLMAGEGDSLADAAKVVVSAEIIAQAKSEKVIVFKKRRRHNYRRKAGHRQQMTLLRIVQVGDDKYEKSAPKAEAAPIATAPVADAAPLDTTPAATSGDTGSVDTAPAAETAAAKPKKAKAAAPAKDTGTAGEGMVDAPAKKKPAKKAAAPQDDSATDGAADSE